MRLIAGFLFPLGLLAQTATFPTAVVTDSQMMVGGNNLATVLTAPVAPSDTTLSVITTNGLVPNMLLTFFDTREIVVICGIPDGTHLTLGYNGTCPGTSGRGFNGTTAAAHAAQIAVSANYTAWHRDVDRVEIEAIETALGASLSHIVAAGPNSSITSITGLTTPLAVNQGGTGTTTPALTAGAKISITGSWPNNTVATTGAAASGANTDITSLASLTTPLSVAQGGSGTNSPSILHGSNISVTGAWPNQTIGATGLAASGPNSDITSLTGLTTPLSQAQGGTGTITPSLTAGGKISITGTWPNNTIATSGVAASGANSDITSLAGLTTPLSTAQGGTGNATPGLVAGSHINITGSWPNNTIAATGLAASPVNADITALTGLTTPLSVAQGGTGTATPALVAGTNVSITGTWPNQTIGVPTFAANTTSTAHNFFTAYNSTTGAFSKAQPACADLSDAAASCATDATNATNVASGTLSNLRLSMWGSGTRPVAASALGTAGDCVQWSTLGLGDTGSPCGAGGGGGANALGTYFVSSTTNAPANAVNLGLLSTGILNISVAAGVATPSTAVAGDFPTLNQNTSGTAANLSGTPALPNGTAATTQTQADSTTKIATTAYVDTGLATKASSTASTTVNGQTCTLGLSCTIPLSAINAQTTTYQVLAGDFSNYKTITIASGTFTVTLVANTSQPANGQYLDVINYGSGVVTIARSGQTINGGVASLTLPAASATAPSRARLISDGTNYFAALAEVPATTTCTNQAVTAVNGTAASTCTTLSSAYVDTSIAKTGTDINTSNQVTATHLAAALPVNQGGTGTLSTLTGLMRGSVSAMSAAELSGDCTTSGSNATTCTKTSGVSFGTAATQNTGTSGATIALLNGNNIYSGSATFTGALDASGATHTLPMLKGLNSAKPATCTVSELYFATDLTAGQQILECSSTNTWTQQLNSGSSGQLTTHLQASSPYTDSDTNTQVFNNTAGAFTLNLPSAAANSQICVANYTGRSGAITVQMATGDHILYNGANNTTAGGTIVSNGNLGDALCMTGAATNQWVAWNVNNLWTFN